MALLTYNEVLEITKINETFKMKHQKIGNTEIAMCTYFLANAGDFFDAKLDGSMVRATELRGITFVKAQNSDWKTYLFIDKFFNIGQTNGTNITNMELSINNHSEICNINKLFVDENDKTYRAIDLKLNMTVAEFDRNNETHGDFFKILSLDKKVLPTLKPENSWMYEDVKDLEIVRVANKEDGSAIRFLLIEGELVAKTKFSFEAEQCKLAMEIVEKDPKLKAFILATLEFGYAAIFEIVSPFNKIVLSYPETSLKLLQLRDENNDGLYLNIYDHTLVKAFNVLTAEQEPLYTLDELLKLKETVEDKEGWVITFENGKMAKVKTDWYMSLHGILTDGLKEHKIVEKVLDETIDDTIAMIPEENVEERDFIDSISEIIVNHVNHIVSDAETKFKNSWNGNKKDLALKFKDDKGSFPYIMSFANGKNIEEVEKQVIDRVKFECRRLEMAKQYLKKLGFDKELEIKIEDD